MRTPKDSPKKRTRKTIVGQSQIEQVLRKSLKELSDIKFALDASAIVAVTDKKGKIIYANDKFCEISKYSRKELLGQDHRIINSGYHSKEFFKDLWQTIARGNVWRAEIRNRAKDGRYYWVDTTIVPFFDEKGKPYQYVAIRYEITKRKQMEAQLKQLSQRIIQAHEEERARISREIHDDLGQSLATLKMIFQANQSKYIKGDLKACQMTLDYLNGIIDKTRHLASGLRPSTLEVLGLSTSIKTMMNDMKLKKNLDVKFQHGRLDQLQFKGEAINLFRIVQEACTNAVKHARATKLEVIMRKRGDRLYVFIRDNGQGFPVDSIRGPRTRLQGLGLSTMEERARLLEGNLNIVSQPRKGTIISLDLPIKMKGQ